MNDTLQEVFVDAGRVTLEGTLNVPPSATGIVLFAHGSGSSRHSPRNHFVASALGDAGLATLLFDLMTPEEEARDQRTLELRFDIPFLAERLVGAIDWVRRRDDVGHYRIGLFGASTGAAAALIAAAWRPDTVSAIVSRGGRPDLARDALPLVQAPTLLIVGGDDEPVIHMNRQALARVRAPKRLEVVPGATHLFEQPGKLERVATLARGWFRQYLCGERYATRSEVERAATPR